MLAVDLNPLQIFGVLVEPIKAALKWFVAVLGHVPVMDSIGAFGVAVVLTTLVIRTLLYPVFGWQLKTTRKTQREQQLIQPQIKELRKKYKGDPQRQTAEMQKLYKEHGISPLNVFQGCLPMFVQLPVVIGLYQAIGQTVKDLSGNRGFDAHFLWVSDVSKSVNQIVGKDFLSGLLQHPTALLLPLAAAAATYVQSRMMMPPMRPDMTEQEKSMQSVSRNMSYIFPIVIIMMSLSFPQGVAIYWVTQSLFMVLQQYILVGWGAMNVPTWLPGAHRVTPLSYPRHTASDDEKKRSHDKGVVTTKTKRAPGAVDFKGLPQAPPPPSAISAAVSAGGEGPRRSPNKRKKRR